MQGHIPMRGPNWYKWEWVYPTWILFGLGSQVDSGVDHWIGVEAEVERESYFIKTKQNVTS